MLRDKNLIPLSRQHQHALALCVRLDRALRAGEVDLEAWQAEIQQQFKSEIGVHFAAEEEILFPAVANFTDLRALIQELLADHALLRDYSAGAAVGDLNLQSLADFGEKLAQHIRKEERQLFERLQRLLPPQEMAAMGVSLESALRQAAQSCILPSEATRLYAGKD